MLSDPLASLLDPLFVGWRNGARQNILYSVAGHHGSPPELSGEPTPTVVVCQDCLAAATKFTRWVMRSAPPSLPQLTSRERHALVWWLSGFVNLADWVGSNQIWFQTVDATTHASLSAYWAQACAQAEHGVREAGLIPSAVSLRTGMKKLFPERHTRRPLQRWAERVTIPVGPCLFILEDSTGSGKTEAALVLAHRLMMAGRGDGAYVALPTMATSNAMYGRLALVYRRLFTPAARPSLVLAHSKRLLNDAFTDSILAGPADDTNFDDAAAECAAWIASNKKRAFLAQVGVGTVDQALLSVLPVRHATMRLLGLSRRVLIVDEAHAYDAYMGTELARLLEFHAALGGSAIVLSATLTAKQREELANAFRTGLNAPINPAGNSKAYPAATTVSAASVVTTPVSLARELWRSVAVTRVPTMNAVANEIVRAARVGAAVCWVRNTVDDAIEAAQLLRAHGLTPILFHARFAMGDRLATEAEVLRVFGPASSPADRHGRVLVATQVVEQSLDLDFDLLVSDLAPADLVIQRAGRLWRHPHRTTRPVATARLLLLSPDPIPNPARDWMGDARTRWVYQNPAVLWRSAYALLTAGRVVTRTSRVNVPARTSVRALVEAAYDDTNTPPGLQRATTRAEGSDARAIGIAHQNVLEFSSAYDRSVGLWDSDERTPTRLGDLTITIRLARHMRGRLLPWCGADWHQSEISIRAIRLLDPAIDAMVNAPKFAPMLAALRAGWPRWDQEVPVLVLRPFRGRRDWRAQVLNRQGAPTNVTYSKETGWQWN